MADISEQDEMDLDVMRGAFGLYVGMLTEREANAFNRLCASGLARRSYSGPAAIMGLSRAERINPSTKTE